MNVQPLDILLFVGLPYASIAVFIAGLIWRYRSRFTISSLSSQVLESRALVWGSVPFHFGIAILFFGHLLPLVIPRQWAAMLANRPVLLTVEAIGLGAAFLCILGLVVLFIRRVANAAVWQNSTAADLFVLLVLLAQAVLGVAVALGYRWGAVWSTATTTPYLWSLLTLRPEPAFVVGMPVVMSLHLTAAWLVLAALPFTRLVHMFSVPLGYLGRPPQKVVWAMPPRAIGEGAPPPAKPAGTEPPRQQPQIAHS